MLRNLLFAIILFIPFVTTAQLSVYAGDSIPGYGGDGAPAVMAQLHYPASLAFDGAGNLYIGDIGNYRIRRVSPSGIITTYAGNGNPGCDGDGGPATAASLNALYLAADAAGNVYFSDPIFNRIRKIDTNGIVNTFAGTGEANFSGDGGPATIARVNNPCGMAVSASGNIYFADNGNDRVRMITPAGTISTIAGWGSLLANNVPATNAIVNAPTHIATDVSGNIYISSSDTIFKIDNSGIITRYLALSWQYALGAISTDAAGQVYFISSTQNGIYKLGATKIELITGGPTGQLNEPTDIAIKDNRIYIAGYNNNEVYYFGAPLAVHNLTESRECSTYPDPNNGSFSIFMNEDYSSTVKISITNLAGQVVQTSRGMSNEPVAISIPGIPGTYMVQVVTDTHECLKKIMVR